MFERFVNYGINNQEKFKHEKNEIYAFKSKQIRIYGFFDSKNNFVCCKGTKKKKNKNTAHINTIIDQCAGYKKILEKRGVENE